MSYFGPALNTTGPITIDADEQAVVHTFGRQAAAVAILIAGVGDFIGTATLQYLDANGNPVDSSGFNLLTDPSGIPQGFQQGGAIPQLAARAGFAQLQVKCSDYTSGSISVTFVDQVTVPGEIQRVIGIGGGSIEVNIAAASALLATRPILVQATGSMTEADSVALLANGDNIIFQVTGDLVGTLAPQITVDGSNYVTISPEMLTDLATGTVPDGAYEAGGVFLLNFGAAIRGFRVLCTDYTSGEAAVTITGTSIWYD